ncbi:4405_t:CDS:2 [Rhizophagus irregularis]|nr:4405_t:CDS:2 [Rhizophagus irregularis]
MDRQHPWRVLERESTTGLASVCDLAWEKSAAKITRTLSLSGVS